MKQRSKITKQIKKQKINETKSWFFKKIKKNEKPLARLIKRKKKKGEAKINKIINENKVTIQGIEIQRIMNNYAPIKWKTQNKGTNFQKATVFQN